MKKEKSMAYKDKTTRPRKGTGWKTVSEWSAILIGKKLGLLTVVKNIGLVDHVQRWECVCDCGKIVNRRTEAFKKNTEGMSCGCTYNARLLGVAVKHGMHKTKEYRTWHGMKQRCYNEKNDGFFLYGGRGIKIHESWVNDFMQFVKDMGPPPDADSSVDRIDPNGNYEPSNCRWATKTEQSNNTRRNKFLVVDGVTDTLANHARKYGINVKTANRRLFKGWSIDDAFKAPLQERVTNLKT